MTKNSTKPLRAGHGSSQVSRILAIDIGGTDLKAALIDARGKILTKRVAVPTPVAAR